jgi:hypothetical protein
MMSDLPLKSGMKKPIPLFELADSFYKTPLGSSTPAGLEISQPLAQQ